MLFVNCYNLSRVQNYTIFSKYITKRQKNLQNTYILLFFVIFLYFKYNKNTYMTFN